MRQRLNALNELNRADSVLTITERFDGSTLFQDKSYDTAGRISSVSMPHKNGANSIKMTQIFLISAAKVPISESIMVV
jgi:hypothetical protein